MQCPRQSPLCHLVATSSHFLPVVSLIVTGLSQAHLSSSVPAADCQRCGMWLWTSHLVIALNPAQHPVALTLCCAASAAGAGRAGAAVFVSSRVGGAAQWRAQRRRVRDGDDHGPAARARAGAPGAGGRRRPPQGGHPWQPGRPAWRQVRLLAAFKPCLPCAAWSHCLLTLT
jgi:hypothetical protein